MLRSMLMLLQLLLLLLCFTLPLPHAYLALFWTLLFRAPVFDKLEAELAKACMSLPASKGFEIGSGFAGACVCEHVYIYV